MSSKSNVFGSSHDSWIDKIVIIIPDLKLNLSLHGRRSRCTGLRITMLPFSAHFSITLSSRLFHFLSSFVYECEPPYLTGCHDQEDLTFLCRVWLHNTFVFLVCEMRRSKGRGASIYRGLVAPKTVQFFSSSQLIACIFFVKSVTLILLIQ
jgi:hypothetical protein